MQWRKVNEEEQGREKKKFPSCHGNIACPGDIALIVTGASSYNDRWNEKQPILILYQSAIIDEPCSPLSNSHPFSIFYLLRPS